ncbi:hypothetical protein FKM82_030411 [Ascaphus truei]
MFLFLLAARTSQPYCFPGFPGGLPAYLSFIFAKQGDPKISTFCQVPVSGIHESLRGHGSLEWVTPMSQGHCRWERPPSNEATSLQMSESVFQGGQFERGGEIQTLQIWDLGTNSTATDRYMML